jgi:hypothetical protein
LADQLTELARNDVVARNLSDFVRERLIRDMHRDEYQEREAQLFKLLGEIEEISRMVARRLDVEWHGDAAAARYFASTVAMQILSHNPKAGTQLSQQDLEQGKQLAEVFREATHFAMERLTEQRRKAREIPRGGKRG